MCMVFLPLRGLLAFRLLLSLELCSVGVCFGFPDALSYGSMVAGFQMAESHKGQRCSERLRVPRKISGDRYRIFLSGLCDS